MTRLSKILIAATLAMFATTSFADDNAWEFKPDQAYMYGGPGKMRIMTMAAGATNHEAMMQHATKVPHNTIFFMDNGELYSVSGTLDPTGNFYRP